MENRPAMLEILLRGTQRRMAKDWAVCVQRRAAVEEWRSATSNYPLKAETLGIYLLSFFTYIFARIRRQ